MAYDKTEIRIHANDATELGCKLQSFIKERKTTHNGESWEIFDRRIQTACAALVDIIMDLDGGL